MIYLITIIMIVVSYVFYLKYKNAKMRKKYIAYCKRTGQPIDDRMDYLEWME